MRRRTRQLAAVLASLLACAGAAAPAAGAAGWVLPPTPLAPAANGPSGAAVAVSPMGDAAVAWTEDDGAGEQSLLVAVRPTGGPWGAPVALAQNVAVDAPAVALDADGDATLLWVESGDGVTYAARAARRTAGGWSAPHDFAQLGRALALTQVRATAGGDAIAAWVEYDDGDGVAAMRAAVWSGGGWGAPATVSDPGDASAVDGRPQIAPDADGGAVLGWTAQRVDAPFDYAVQVSSLDAGGWSAPLDVVTAADPLTPLRLVGDEDGDVAASWFEGDPAATLWGAMRVGGTWSVDAVSDDVAPACRPTQALGADPGGGATVVWRALSTDGLDAVRLTPAGPEPRRTVFAARSEVAHEAAIAGDTIVFAAADVGTNAFSLLATRRTAGGAWSAPALLAPAPSGGDVARPAVAGDADGDALAAWTATDALGGKAVAAAAFQASGPRLTALSVPAAGTAGDALSFSVSARSTFATVQETTWDFGDATPLAAGAAAQHAYAQAGSYTVTVRAVDGLGNATTATRELTIAPAEAPPVDPPVGPPVEPPAGGGGGGGGDPAPPRPAPLARPRLVATNGVVRLGRGSRTLRLVVANGNAARLSGRVTLVRPRSGRRPALTLALERGIALRGARRTTVPLTLGDAALRALRAAPGRRLAVRFALRLRAADGRAVTVSRRLTLDASARFPAVPARARARMAC